MNRIEKIKDSSHWKDRMAGWCHWRIHVPKCQCCGKVNVSYTLMGTREDAETFAKDPQYDCCEKCS